MGPAAVLLWLKRMTVGYFGTLNLPIRYNQDRIDNIEHNDDLLRKIN